MKMLNAAWMGLAECSYPTVGNGLAFSPPECEPWVRTINTVEARGSPHGCVLLWVLSVVLGAVAGTYLSRTGLDMALVGGADSSVCQSRTLLPMHRILLRMGRGELRATQPWLLSRYLGDGGSPMGAMTTLQLGTMAKGQRYCAKAALGLGAKCYGSATTGALAMQQWCCTRL
ncbi:hypothetical protein KIL84_002921 [Mauremys mutica]|uniref:Uncharacterized protein n=1 Tax=Mauremys mutica TaxID=74926 RepID=A0A9D3WU76_9SAUR|nr:hypothetical protein KIL84_002921 [Mauremys mutica]